MALQAYHRQRADRNCEPQRGKSNQERCCGGNRVGHTSTLVNKKDEERGNARVGKACVELGDDGVRERLVAYRAAQTRAVLEHPDPTEG